MKQPHIAALGHKRLKRMSGRLHIFPIDQQMHLGRCGRRLGRGRRRGGRRFGVLGRVLLGVLAQLALHRLFYVHIGVVGQLQQVQQHVGNLIGHALLVGRVAREAARFGEGLPLEQLQQLRRLHHQRHRQVLGRVVGLPIARSGEFAQPGLQCLDVHVPPSDTLFL